MRLPEKYARLGMDMCQDHFKLLKLRTEAALQEVESEPGMEYVVILREAQTMLYDRAPRLFVIEGDLGAG